MTGYTSRRLAHGPLFISNEDNDLPSDTGDVSTLVEFHELLSAAPMNSQRGCPPRGPDEALVAPGNRCRGRPPRSRRARASPVADTLCAAALGGHLGRGFWDDGTCTKMSGCLEMRSRSRRYLIHGETMGFRQRDGEGITSKDIHSPLFPPGDDFTCWPRPSRRSWATRRPRPPRDHR
jgi:hypothetical protein